MSGPIVIKLGGSLLDWPLLPDRLAEFLEERRDEKLAIVVGGGGLVDAIRTLDKIHGFGEKRSHELALRAMSLTARMLPILVPGVCVVEKPRAIEEAWRTGATPVVDPRWFLERVDVRSLPKTWQTTSDSIAARLALHLEASALILLKSASPKSSWTRLDAANAGFVDPVFPRASFGLERVVVVNLKEEPWSEYDLDSGHAKNPHELDLEA